MHFFTNLWPRVWKKFRSWFYIVVIRPKGAFSRKQSTPNFPKYEHFLPPDTHICAFLPYYRQFTTQPAITFSKVAIEILEQGVWNMFKVNNKIPERRHWCHWQRHWKDCLYTVQNNFSPCLFFFNFICFVFWTRLFLIFISFLFWSSIMGSVICSFNSISATI